MNFTHPLKIVEASIDHNLGGYAERRGLWWAGRSPTLPLGVSGNEGTAAAYAEDPLSQYNVVWTTPSEGSQLHFPPNSPKPYHP